ncbi:MAG TPA: anti-sigma factor [Pyrinomonadaceae bacterium]|nr:anti-sigma factor [Pyrinomonadaceae bacterium]
MEHQEYKELLEFHALDALEASEARGLEEHLKTCADCRSELIRLGDAAALLAHAASPAEPRPEMRNQLLASVRAERTQARPAAVTSPQVVPLKPRAGRNIRPIGLRLAAGVAVVALLVSLIVFWRRDVKMRQEIAQLSRQVNTQQHELVRDRDVLGRQREALTLLNMPSAKKMELAGTQTAQGAHGSFVYDQKTGRALLMADGLPATPADKAYELWFIPKGHSPMAGRIFTVDASGHAMLPEQMPSEAMANSVIAITLEPKKGSAVPTGAIYLSSPSS